MKTSQALRFTRATPAALAAAILTLSFGTACQSDSEKNAAIAPERAASVEAEPGESTNAAAPESRAPHDDESTASEQSAGDEDRARAEASKRETKDEEPSAGESSGLEVKRLVVTHEVKDREPVEAKKLEAGNGPVYAFVEMINEAAEESGIVITFEHESGKKVGHVKLDVPGEQPRWRTWGKTRMIDEPGRWDAVVRAADGQELGRQSFEVSQKG